MAKKANNTTPSGTARKKTPSRKITAGASERKKATSAGKRPIQRKKPVRPRKTKQKVVRISSGQMLILAISVICLIAIPLFYKIDSEYGAKVPVGSYRFGIDISHHNQGEPIWDSLKVLVSSSGKTVRSVKAASDMYPIAFVFIKATEGEELRDKNFVNNWAEAGKRNYARGAYHFFRSSKDPYLQAKNFIEAVGELRHIDLPPVVDVETIHSGCTRKELNDKLSVWLKVVTEEYGRKPIIYTSEKFSKEILYEDIVSAYPLWVAHYGVPQPEREDWTYWQFTDRAVVYGIKGYVDLNVVKIR